MANIHIPQTHLPGIKLISEISEEKIRVIYDILNGFPKSGVGIAKFSDAFTNAFQETDMDSIAHAIFSFGQLMTYSDYDAKKTARGLTESYQELADDVLNAETESRLEERLYNILIHANYLATTNEVYSILSDLKTFRRGVINTDIRLFHNRSDYKSRNALLLHKLIIRFSRDGEMDSETFYLDNDDLEDLKIEIEQALADEQNIRQSNNDVLNFIALS